MSYGSNRFPGLGRNCAAVGALIFIAQLASAGSITFNDLTDNLTVTATDPARMTGLNNCTTRPTSESCMGVIIKPPSGYSVVAPLGKDISDYTLIFEGKTVDSGLSDVITRVNVSKFATSLNFFSDGTNEKPLALPHALFSPKDEKPDLTGCFTGQIDITGFMGNSISVRCMTENGAAQLAGTITSLKGAKTNVDSVYFASDVEVPEPGSLLSLGLGLAGILGFARLRSGRNRLLE